MAEITPARLSREDFHKDFAGVLTVHDFCTEYPNPNRNVPHTHIEMENLIKSKVKSPF